MKIDEALKAYDADLVGGQAVVYKDGVHVIIGRHMDGQFVPDDTDAARAVIESAKPKRAKAKAETPTDPEPEQDPEPAPEPDDQQALDLDPASED